MNFARILACLMCFAVCSAATAGTLRGYYVMQPLHGNGQPLTDKVVASASIAGIHVRDPWRLLEPTRGRYDFAYFDQQISRAARLGKHVTLGIYAGVDNDPQWNDLAAFTSLVKAFGARYASNPAVAAVHISAPQVTNESMEMYLPANWKGGNTAAVAIWRQSIDAFNAAFPTTPLILDVAMAPNAKGEITRAVDDYARLAIGSRLTAIVCNLKASTNVDAAHINELERLRDLGVTIGFEMVGPSKDRARFGGTFQQAIALSNALGGGGFYQIYQGDIASISLAATATPEPSCETYFVMAAAMAGLRRSKRWPL